MSRISKDVARGASFTFKVDGVDQTAYPGETVAAALLADRINRFRHDRSNHPRGLLCNMGTCSECIVWIALPGNPFKRKRACLTEVSSGLRVMTSPPKDETGRHDV
jgi:predicted molibdopterin-dependent oxidoreductase YjgC